MKEVFSDTQEEASNKKEPGSSLPISYDILNQGSEIAARIDNQKQFVSVTPAFASLFGYSHEELVNCPLSSLFSDEYEHIFEAAITEAEKVGRSEFKSQAKRKDGSVLFKQGVLIKGIDTNNSLIRFYYFVVDITETELNKLKHFANSKKAYSPSIHDSPDMLIITDYSTGKIVDINDRLLEKFNIEKHSILDKNINELEVLNVKYILKHISKLKKNKIALDDDFIFKNMEENVFFEVSSSLHRNELSDKDFVYTTIKDISNQKIKEKRWKKENEALKEITNHLQKSETKFKSAFGSAPVGMCICNEDATIFDSNQSLQDILKLDPTEIIGLKVFDLIHKKDKEKLDYCFERLIKNKIEHFSLEVCCEDSKNNLHDFFCNCSSIIDNQNNSKHIIFHFQNISSRKMAERALQKSEERFRLLYNGMPSMFFTISRDKTIRSINKYGAKHLGYNIVELSDKSIDTIISTKDIEKNTEHIEACFEDVDKIHRWQLQTKHKDNSLIWVRITARHIRLDKFDNEDFLYIVAEDISETQRLSEKLSYQATHDPLTGLNNRIEFERRLKNALETRSHNAEHALCYMDLDNFKIINDTSGHLAGDELLRQLSIVLKQKLRQSDVLARLGGDEFGILMENCSLKFARRTIEGIRQTIEEFRFVWQDKKFTIGSSMGLVPISESFSKVEDILSAADAACYTAKDTGRNRIHIFFPNDIELNRKRGEMEWVSRITNALEENKFVLYFQEIKPVTKTHDDIHIELLIRLQGDNGELIPPGAFLSSAERYNIVSKIDRWVVETALEKLSSPEINLDLLGQCNINLSGQSLGNRDFSRFLFKAISESEVPSSILCFEVTETAAIANLASAIRFIRALKIQGCSFALDDFGSGVSSFGYLKNLPVDYLKIDGTFVRDIIDDDVDFTMVKSINDIGQVMNKKTVAEFVENEKINEKLSDIGVDYVQGYNIHTPEPLDNLVQHLKK